jgi:hypothetical protein
MKDELNSKIWWLSLGLELLARMWGNNDPSEPHQTLHHLISSITQRRALSTTSSQYLSTNSSTNNSHFRYPLTQLHKPTMAPPHTTKKTTTTSRTAATTKGSRKSLTSQPKRIVTASSSVTSGTSEAMDVEHTEVEDSQSAPLQLLLVNLVDTVCLCDRKQQH